MWEHELDYIVEITSGVITNLRGSNQKAYKGITYVHEENRINGG